MSQKNNQLTASLLPLLRDSLGAQLLPTWILFIVNPDPCKSHFPVFLPPQSLLPSIRAGLPMVQLSDCHLVNFSLLSNSKVVCFLSPWWLVCAWGWWQAQADGARHMWPIFYGWTMAVLCCAVLPHPALPETLQRHTGRSLIQNFIFLSFSRFETQPQNWGCTETIINPWQRAQSLTPMMPSLVV